MKHTAQRSIIFIIFLVVFSNTYAQKEATWWYFGDHTGLNFTEVLKGKATIPTCVSGPISTWEGCFSISDRNGNFLLASDGINVYNKYGNLVNNGTGLNGNSDATQSGIVIPRPSYPNQYYIVTVPSAQATRVGINYSIVDLNADGGVGRVTDKNILISLNGSNLTLGDLYENITSVRHANKIDYWLAHKARDKFLVWLVTKDGIKSDPIVTNTGRDLGTDNDPNGKTLGYIKFSPDGKKIAHPGGDTGWLTVGDFDNATGKITNIRERNLPVEHRQPLYGLEFSPNGKFIYVAEGWRKLLRMVPTDDIVGGVIKKYNINPTAIQSGPDGKIYGINTYSNTLYIINDPDHGGTDITTLNNFFTNGLAGLGLPTFIASFFYVEIDGDNVFCFDSQKSFKVKIETIGSLSQKPKYTVWDFGDGTNLTAFDDTNVPGTQSKTHTYDRPGNYKITVKIYDENKTEIPEMMQTFDVNVKPCVLPVNPNKHNNTN